MPLRQQLFTARPRPPLRLALLWAVRVVALLAAAYVLAVAALGVVPRPREAPPCPRAACSHPASGPRARRKTRNRQRNPERGRTGTGECRKGTHRTVRP